MENKKTFTVLCWNIASIINHVTSIPFPKVIPYLKKINPDIFCLQEFYFAKRLLTNRPYFNKLDVIIPPNNNGSGPFYKDSVLMGNLDLKDNGVIDFQVEGFKEGNAIWANFNILEKKIRIYNCHLPLIGIGLSDRAMMIKKVIDHADMFDGPVIICGDMNTTIPANGFSRLLVKLANHPPKNKQFINGKYYSKDERYFFKKIVNERGFKELLDIKMPTWVLPKTKIEYPNLKLDWFLTRGIKVRLVEIGPYISDHRPIIAECEI